MILPILPLWLLILLSQAEHGTDSQVLLFTTSETMAGKVHAEVDRQLEDPAAQGNCCRITGTQPYHYFQKIYDEIMDMVNEYAPEHLIICHG